MSIFDDIRKALEAGEPHCLKCGLPRSNHIYRHPFQPSHTTTLETIAPDMARIALAAEELADSVQRSDPWEDIDAALAAFRAACGEGE